MTARLLLPLTLLLAATAFAQNLRVLTVPAVALDPAVPHAAYNGHPTLLKAIARGGDGNYAVEWDYEGDGTFDVASTRTNRYDLSTAVTFPSATTDRTYEAVVRVTSNGQTVTATYPVRVYADVPANPNLATERQLQVMRNVATDDGLWFLHNQLARVGNEDDPLTGAQISASIPTTTFKNISSASFLEALGRHQHYPAFPAAYLGEMPNVAENAARWANDPYAEDAARLVNGMLAQTSVVSVPTSDETNLVGFYPERTATPIPGTDDGIGLYLGYTSGDLTNGPLNNFLRALAVSHLTGYVAQVGDANRILGRRMEFVVQQLVDGLVWAQNDGANAGSWYYNPNAGNDLLGELGAGVMDAAEALLTVEQFMKNDGVIVPNFVKARLLDYIRMNANPCPTGGTGGTWTSNYNGVCDFALSAAHLTALGWVGANAFAPTDTRLAFPSYYVNSAITRAQLRAQYDSTLVFIGNTFTGTSAGAFGWDQGFVEAGDFSRVDGRGNHFAMLHWARAARAVEPDVTTFGANAWSRMFARYLINNQAPGGGWTWTFSTTLNTNSDNYLDAHARAAFAILAMTPDDLVPVVSVSASQTNAPEGTSLTFTGLSSVPGTFTWDLGNGDTRTGSSLAYAFPDDGTFLVTLTVRTPGGTSVSQSLTVVIANAAPVANAGADLAIDEGEVASFVGSFSDPGTADTHTFSWIFGDTQSATTRVASHAYADQGTFTATFRVTDDENAPGSDTATITVRNVAPTITSWPSVTATEGTAWTYPLTFSDPGTADTHTCSLLTAPAGASLNGCTLQWAPSAGTFAFTACVTDDDGARTCQSFVVVAAILDTDNDGLSDPWETARFGSLAQTASADPDLDGLTNLAELLAGTDPTVFDGPSAPVATCVATATSGRPTLTVTNAVDPQLTALRYEFELYDDAALTSLVSSASDVPAGATSTSWRVPVPLQENGRFYWRARAHDASVAGAWTMPACSFLVDAVNELPGAPRLDSPAPSAAVSELRPTLVVGNAIDPEQDLLTYDFEVYQGPTRLLEERGVTEGTGTSSWRTPTLTEDTEYTWRARAVSAGGPGPWSETGLFRVNTANTAPSAPVVLFPQQGTLVETLTPTLLFLPTPDADGDALVFDWELADDERFAAPLASGVDVTQTRLFVTSPLAEDSRRCWRVRADDGQAQSEWVRACFTISTSDGAPGVPTPFNPSDGSVVTTLTPVFSWARAVDPEGAPVFYDVELKQGDAVVATMEGVSGNAAVSSVPLSVGKDWTWRVRATTAVGPASEYSSASHFEVQELKPATGCGCGSMPSGLLMLLAPLLVLRRRRAATAASRSSGSPPPGGWPA